MKYVYGPVPSRRLGRSLGVDIVPLKTCNYQCIYCQLGKTTNFTNIRTNYFPKNKLINEIKNAINENKEKFDYITFVGSGEPTLYKDIGELISTTKNLTNKPICVITNGSLLYVPEVRNALLLADVVLPSLDGGDKIMFKKINRPHPSLNFDTIIQGFKDFKKIYKGKFWIEIMLMRDINDSKKNLLKIKKIVDSIKPDRIDINVPIRPPAEKWVKKPRKNLISNLNEIFIEYNNINYPEMGSFKLYSPNLEEELLSIIKRHPMRFEQIIETFSSENLSRHDLLLKLEEMELENKIQKTYYNKKIFWKLK
ncbi:MAG: radical SAM protein [Candidatus Lokiarchaeota archaeon]|nr:radical SAM protein [Candidatus Lokiarchaeota archaeon]